MTDAQKSIKNPGSVFKNPQDVLKKNDLTREQKIEILRRWEYDAREQEVAEEENMGGGQPSMLQQIRKALLQLGYKSDDESAPPIKQGGF